MADRPAFSHRRERHGLVGPFSGRQLLVGGAAIVAAVVILVAVTTYCAANYAGAFHGPLAEGAPEILLALAFVGYVTVRNVRGLDLRRRMRVGVLVGADIALQVLKEGNAFAIYPEGTRSEDGRLYRGHTGVGWLALNAQASVVPVAVKGTEKIMPVGARIPLPRLRRPGVKFGKPIDYTAFADLPPAKARRAMTDEIMREIQKLSGQEYAGVYNERSRKTG